MQRRWADNAPARFATLVAQRSFQAGTAATLLGCELAGMAGGSPRWRAVSVGDTVLFHVRNHRLLRHFPPLRPDDFGVRPPTVHTKADHLDQMLAHVAFGEGELRAGDRLYVATDALAHWMLRGNERDGPAIWRLLARLDHHRTFDRLVANLWRRAELGNDDVTLLVVNVLDRPATEVVVCL
jgi:hypothetical protein